jgi:hypothetical protein
VHGRNRIATALTALATVSLLGAGAGPALATNGGGSSSQANAVTSPIDAGNDRVTVGSATLARTRSSDGKESLQIDASVPGGVKESHVCYGSSPYSSRVQPGQCPLSQGQTGAAAHYTVDLGTAFVSSTVYIQLHVATGSDTAYAGWQQGNPYYGNVAVDAVSSDASLPVGVAGGAGLALLLGLGLLATARRQGAR